MKFNWRSLIPSISWKKDTEKQELMDLIDQLTAINRGLNMSIGNLVNQMDGLKEEALGLLTSIVLMHGEELIVSKDFMDAAGQGNLFIKIDKLDSGEISLKVGEQTDEEVCQDERDEP